MPHPPPSLSSIQKSKTGKTNKSTLLNVLPRSSLIQIYLENNNSTKLNLNKSSVILPKFSNQDLAKISNSSDIVQTQTFSQIKKSLKEKKFKELTRICLNQHNHADDRVKGTVNFDSNVISNPHIKDEDLEQVKFSQVSNMQLKIRKTALLSHLANDFFLDCKQRLDINSFKSLLSLLINHKSSNIKYSPKNDRFLLDNIYELLKQDKHLLNKYSAFLTNENSLYYDLLMQNKQYEKCFEFFSKLELFIPNKLSFKRLIQSIVTSSSISLENETISKKVDEVKARIKSIVKNNELINIELDHMFDQRNANLEPLHEKISLIEKNIIDDLDDYNDELINAELIDLTRLFPVDYGTKKCSCKCHKLLMNEEDDYNHCILCSLKLIKGKLSLKCEGKKAIPLIYKLD